MGQNKVVIKLYSAQMLGENEMTIEVSIERTLGSYNMESQRTAPRMVHGRQF